MARRTCGRVATSAPARVLAVLLAVLVAIVVGGCGLTLQPTQAPSSAPGTQGSGSGSQQGSQQGQAGGGQSGGTQTGDDQSGDELTVEEDGWYTDRDSVALYIHTYGHLPGNFISKTKAREAGWVASEGNLDEVLPGMSIGGSVYYNDDGQLPDAPGRRWTECDINYHGGYRGPERIVFSNDGLIFYTDDHYETFVQLY